MRIISGSKRGMKLLPPKNYDTRPITDRAKESLFSVLYKYDVIEAGIVADLFSGTGSMGLECLSRGAKWVTFCEKDAKVVEILNKNIEKAVFVAESKVIRANIFKIGAPLLPADFGDEKYNLVFVDPPYKMAYETGIESRLGKLLVMLCEQAAEGAIIVVRTNKRAELLENYGTLNIIDRREWGTMAVTLLENSGSRVERTE